MEKIYRVLAWSIVALVAVQAAALAWGAAGESHFIDHGGVVDKAMVEAARAGGEPPFVEGVGFLVHGLNGGILIPVLALALFACSFLVKRPRSRTWASAVLLLVALQTQLGYVIGDIPALGLLHGANALLVAGVSWQAGRRIVAARAPDREAVAA